MKRLPLYAALAFGLGLALSTHAFAQQQGGAASQHMHTPDPQQQLDRLTKQLQLTNDQQAKIGPILQQRQQQMDALRGDSSLQPADRRAKVMSIMKDANDQIDAVLTPAQRDQVKAMREKAMERMEQHRGQHAPSSSSSSGG
ncbi:hypothetical protein [Dyella sedimenti]|uniref:hypothetical protein n=1 Tax=Dyella sedimenti TaxID=2919947 RepID=UPI001FAB0807|nr:hypothetical protein [Dyella sedimenti]